MYSLEMSLLSEGTDWLMWRHSANRAPWSLKESHSLSATLVQAPCPSLPAWTGSSNGGVKTFDVTVRKLYTLHGG